MRDCSLLGPMQEIWNWEKTYVETFSVVFLGPGANAELVHKFDIALHASHAALPTVSSKFRRILALPMLDQNVTTMQPFRSHIQINSDHIEYLYLKVQWVLPGNLQNRRYNFFPPPPNVLSLTNFPLSFFFLSLSLFT
jgi:hypothetical protein